MTIKDNKSVRDEQRSLTLVEVLNIASSGYPDNHLSLYYNQVTGEFNEQGSGDTLAEFIVREIIETFDPAQSTLEQLSEVCRALRNAMSEVQGVLEAVAQARGDKRDGG